MMISLTLRAAANDVHVNAEEISEVIENELGTTVRLRNSRQYLVRESSRRVLQLQSEALALRRREA